MKAEALVDSIEAQFQQVDGPLDPAVMEMVDEAMHTYKCASESEPKLTDRPEAHNSSRDSTVARLRIRTLLQIGSCDLPVRAITFLAKVFNAVLLRLGASMETCSRGIHTEDWKGHEAMRFVCRNGLT